MVLTVGPPKIKCNANLETKTMCSPDLISIHTYTECKLFQIYVCWFDGLHQNRVSILEKLHHQRSNKTRHYHTNGINHQKTCNNSNDVKKKRDA